MTLDFSPNPGATEAVIERARQKVGELSDAYLQYIRQSNGGEGLVDENYYILWEIENISRYNEEYEVKEYAPDLLLFGSNGGGESYAFDRRSAGWPVVMVPFIGMSIEYAIVAAPIAENFFRKFLK